MSLQKGRVAYEPNSLSPDAPRESMERGFTTSARQVEGITARVRSESFSDHYSQARLFYRSITPPEQKHLANALTFELGKVETEAIRLRMLGHLQLIDKNLADAVIGALGAEGKADKITPAKAPVDLETEPCVAAVWKVQADISWPEEWEYCLVPDSTPRSRKQLVSQIESEGAKAATVTSKIQGELDSSGQLTPARYGFASVAIGFIRCGRHIGGTRR